MLKGIVVVESPAKAKTLEGYLGKDYKVIASYGHIRDLVSKSGSVDPNNHYKMIWAFNDRGSKQIAEISKLLKLSDNLFLATDPDREGEAISWHILESLNEKKLLKSKNIKRVVFHEITKNAINHAFETPKELDQNLVEAYLARRVLDYLVGFSLSPILWRKMPGAKSAGRVQSVALRLIVERELEIQKFKSEEYWSLHAEYGKTKNDNFTANLTHLYGKKLEKLGIKIGDDAEKIKSQLSVKDYFVNKIEKKAVKRNPSAPFTTSTLQQESVRKLGFSAKKTMTVAQKLYEGISLDGNLTGLITYMRTDSTNLSEEALSETRKFIDSTYGKQYVPSSARVYKTKTKNAQEAHEAIRPTSVLRTPLDMSAYLNADELSLYDLIWKRTVSSQMQSAVLDQVSVDVFSKDKEAQLKATGSTVSFDGFLKVYVESNDEENSEDKKAASKMLPVLKEGQDLDLKQIIADQHFTQPPARFNEASLVKKLEELGIGRPSTYASIINVLQERKYVTLQKRTFIPESTGFLVISFLRNFFSKYVEYGFTASLEEELDDISNGTIAWEATLDNFWKEFNSTISTASGLSITEVIDTVEKDINDYIFRNLKDYDRTCPLCHEGTVGLKLGRYGSFLGCSKYPECKYTLRLDDNQDADPGEPISAFEKPAKIEVGVDKNNNDDVVFLKKGPYGYYFEWEKTKDLSDPKKKKPKRLAVPKMVEDPSVMTIDDVMTLSTLPKNLGQFKGKEVSLCYGRFGPFLKLDGISYKLDKNIGFLRTSLEEATEVIKKAGK